MGKLAAFGIAGRVLAAVCCMTPLLPWLLSALGVSGALGYVYRDDVLLPILAHAAMQVPGGRWQYECAQLEEKITEARQERRRLVAERAPEGFDSVFFTTGGTEALENAIRAARAVTGRRKVLSFYRSYHGNTMAAINSTQ